jgi:iron complex outermembrane receptor protein
MRRGLPASALGIAGLAGAALAQEPEPAAQPSPELSTVAVPEEEPENVDRPRAPATVLEPIAVTGTRIKMVDYETTQPILRISREDLDHSGQTSLGEFLQDLSIASQSKNTAVNGGTGQTEISLRHLGSNRVLVLVNGRRWVNGLDPFSSSSVDLNTIPMSIIESIEVLKDGASAVYGTDAVAGVINIITRRNYSGSELRAQFGFYPKEGDGRNDSLSFSWGSGFGKTNAFLDLSYTRQQPVLSRDRAATKDRVFGGGRGRGHLNASQGLFIFLAGPTVAQECDKGSTGDPPDVFGPSPGDAVSGFLVGTAISQSLCFLTLSAGQDGREQTDFRNYDPINDASDDRAAWYLQTPSERSALFSLISHEFGNGMSFQGEFLYNLRQSRQLTDYPGIVFGDFIGDPNLLITDTYVAVDNPYNPFGQDIGRGSASAAPARTGAPGIGSGIVVRGLPEAGVQFAQQKVDTWRAGGGLNDSLDWPAHPIGWEAGLILADSRNRENPGIVVNTEHVKRALGPSGACSEDPACVTFNVFGGQGVDGRGSITADMLGYILAPSPENSQRQSLKDAYLYLSQKLFDLPAGPMETAYGLEFRREFFADTPNALAQAGLTYDLGAAATAGGYDVKEGYAEFKLPLLRDRFWAETLELSLAARYSKYTRFHGDTNTKLGLRWKPYEDLLLRGTWSNTFRAPSVSELYLGTHYAGFGGQDPCIKPANQTVQDNCTQDGASGALPVSDSLYFSGNPDLVPEKGRNLTAGFVYNPGFLSDLNFYLDWYRIDLNNAILALGGDFALHECYYRAERSPLCSRIERNDFGTLTAVRSSYFNVPYTRVEGVDLTLGYDLPWHGLGQFKLHADATYLIKARFLFAKSLFSFDGSQEGDTRPLDVEGQRYFEFALPRWKARAGLNWSRSNWEAAWSARYIHRMSEACTDEFDPSFVPTLTALGLCSEPNLQDYKKSRNTVKAVIYHNLQIGYRLPDSETELSLGLNNVFDEQPPPSYSYPNQSFDPTTYDVPGRFAYLRVSQRF